MSSDVLHTGTSTRVYSRTRVLVQYMPYWQYSKMILYTCIAQYCNTGIAIPLEYRMLWMFYAPSTGTSVLEYVHASVRAQVAPVMDTCTHGYILDYTCTYTLYVTCVFLQELNLNLRRDESPTQNAPTPAKRKNERKFQPQKEECQANRIAVFDWTMFTYEQSDTATDFSNCAWRRCNVLCVCRHMNSSSCCLVLV